MINLNDIANGKLLSKLLNDCKAKESSRYALTALGVDRANIVATDGKCLVAIQYKACVPQVDSEEPQLMDLQGEIAINSAIEGRFPKYADIIGDQSRYILGLKKIELDLIGFDVKGKSLKKAIDSLMQDITTTFGTIIDRIDYADKQLFNILSLQDSKNTLQSITVSNVGIKSPLHFVFTFDRFAITYIVMPICGRAADYTLGTDITPKQTKTSAA